MAAIAMIAIAVAVSVAAIAMSISIPIVAVAVVAVSIAAITISVAIIPAVAVPVAMHELDCWRSVLLRRQRGRRWAGGLRRLCEAGDAQSDEGRSRQMSEVCHNLCDLFDVEEQICSYDQYYP